MADNGWVRVASLEDVPPGTLKAVRHERVYYAVVNLGGNVYAVDNECPHRGGPLGGGLLVGEEVACPWHGFRFDPRTGKATMPSEHEPVACIATRVVDGSIELDLSGVKADDNPAEPEIGETYPIEIVSEFESQWTGQLGIGQIGEYDVQVPKGKTGEKYRVRVMALGKNQWTGKKEATVEVIPA
ncbi:MAG: Rieske 2Fe-2S domain-containing protein [Chloroflexi bacterium]|nr:Rieske 2Fe-2S domain-containing protein [Chloroflexota bacterium]